jgi:hypothetical protein
MKRDTQTNARMSPALAGNIFSGLAASVREVDFFGWYRADRIAGAVLAQAAAPSADVSSRVVERLADALCARLSSAVWQQLHVKVVRPPHTNKG